MGTGSKTGTLYPNARGPAPGTGIGGGDTMCVCCKSEHRDEIDKALLAGGEVRKIGARFGLPKSSVQRHKTHISATLAMAHRAGEVARADDLLEQVRRLSEEAAATLRSARDTGDLRAANGAIRESLRSVELQARLLGELREGVAVQVNVLATPEIVSVRTRLLEALLPYPEARVAAARALDQGGAGGA